MSAGPNKKRQKVHNSVHFLSPLSFLEKFVKKIAVPNTTPRSPNASDSRCPTMHPKCSSRISSLTSALNKNQNLLIQRGPAPFPLVFAKIHNLVSEVQVSKNYWGSQTTSHLLRRRSVSRGNAAVLKTRTIWTAKKKKRTKRCFLAADSTFCFTSKKKTVSFPQNLASSTRNFFVFIFFLHSLNLTQKNAKPEVTRRT